jgi:hypothetical protein
LLELGQLIGIERPVTLRALGKALQLDAITRKRHYQAALGRDSRKGFAP